MKKYLFSAVAGVLLVACNQTGSDSPQTGLNDTIIAQGTSPENSGTQHASGIQPHEGLFKTWIVNNVLADGVVDTVNFPVGNDRITFEKSGACRFMYGDNNTDVAAWTMPFENELDIRQDGESMVTYKVLRLDDEHLDIEFELNGVKGRQMITMQFVPDR